MLYLFIKLFLLFINSISLNALFGYDVNNCESHNKQFSDVSVLDGHSSSERWFDIQSLSSFPHVANQYRYSYVYSAQLIVG